MTEQAAVSAQSAVQKPPQRTFTATQVTFITVLTVIGTALVGWWVVRTFIFPAELRPVQLSVEERIELDSKLRLFGVDTARAPGSVNNGQSEAAVPEPYRESPGQREITLSERELNGLLARDLQLGSRVAIDLAADLASIVALIPVPPDFPIMPGRTLRVTAGAEISFRSGRPVVMLRGVSVMGVPVPDAWLGNLKNVDLVREFGGDEGFWKSFAAGVEEIRVQDGQLFVRLRE